LPCGATRPISPPASGRLDRSTSIAVKAVPGSADKVFGPDKAQLA
jgi:hypothetical protein